MRRFLFSSPPALTPPPPPPLHPLEFDPKKMGGKMEERDEDSEASKYVILRLRLSVLCFFFVFFV